MKTLRDVEVKDKTVLVRVDYNVPLEELDGQMVVASNLRIRASLPTIMYLREHGAKKIILISHLGRPEGRDEKLSLAPVAEALAMVIAESQADAGGANLPLVEFVDDIVGKEVEDAVARMPKGGILVLQNLRFDAREKANDESLAQEIIASTGAELFVEDGFGVVHRAATSTVAMAKLLPAVMGLLVEKEVNALTRTLNSPEEPLVVVIGGSKVEDKQPLIEKFLPKADKILVGGKIAADGYTADNEKIYVAEDFDENAERDKLDIGPVATVRFIQEIAKAKTVLWNGVLGKVEDAAFTTGSEIIARYLGEHPEITAVICGGDTAGFVTDLMDENPELKYSLVSTGGGAALTLLTGGEMPGLSILD